MKRKELEEILSKKNNRGITLIALVITVIVLLILAGVTIAMLTGDNGILNRAGEAKEKTEKATWDEQKDLIILGAQIYAERENIGMAEYLTKEFEQIDSSATVTDVGNGYYVKCNNQKFIYDNDLNEYEVNEGNDEDWIWTEDSEGNITLTGCKNIYDGNITIPNFINDKPVKIIGRDIFLGNLDLLEIKISY